MLSSMKPPMTARQASSTSGLTAAASAKAASSRPWVRYVSASPSPAWTSAGRPSAGSASIQRVVAVASSSAMSCDEPQQHRLEVGEVAVERGAGEPGDGHHVIDGQVAVGPIAQQGLGGVEDRLLVGPAMGPHPFPIPRHHLTDHSVSHIV